MEQDEAATRRRLLDAVDDVVREFAELIEVRPLPRLPRVRLIHAEYVD